MDSASPCLPASHILPNCSNCKLSEGSMEKAAVKKVWLFCMGKVWPQLALPAPTQCHDLESPHHGRPQRTAEELWQLLRLS